MICPALNDSAEEGHLFPFCHGCLRLVDAAKA